MERLDQLLSSMQMGLIVFYAVLGVGYLVVGHYPKAVYWTGVVILTFGIWLQQ